ncbi:hypothetical protein ACIRF8_12830 [Streptomyces sp. NPDC102406]
MALRRDMPTRDPKAANKDSEHTREYQASKGGFYKPAEKPTPGQRKA